MKMDASSLMGEICDIKGQPVSDPYVIWTMRRTGGTTLATLLSDLSEHNGIEHEPFNRDRIFGHVSEAFRQTDDDAQLRTDLKDIFAKKPVIKHCYELVPPAFNKTLFDVTSSLGYQHIILDRRNEADRIISLELARITGAWGGDAAKKLYPAIEAGEVMLEPLDVELALRQMNMCHKRRLMLAEMTADAQPAPFVVYFEDVYNDPQRGRELISQLLAFLGIHPEDHVDYAARVDDALLKRGQNSARILQAVPNASAAEKSLRESHSLHSQVFVAS
jgi:hypothetical protein